MNVLVTGAGGFLGREVVAQFVARGHHVRAMVRPFGAVPEWPSTVDVVKADLRVASDLRPLLEGIDCLVHLASATSGNEDIQFSSTVVGSEKLIEALAALKVSKIVLVSSLVVYDWEKVRNCLTERSPPLVSPYDMGGYTIAKVWQERIFQRAAEAHGWDLRIVRPGFIWGPQHTKLAGMGRSAGPFHFVFAPRARLPLTHVSNCADCIVAVASDQRAKGETFNVIDGDSVRTWRYAKEYVKRTGAKKMLIPVPYQLGLLAARGASWVSRKMFGKHGKLPSLLTPRRYEAQFKPIRFSSEKLRALTGWTPPVDFAGCLQSSYAAERL